MIKKFLQKRPLGLLLGLATAAVLLIAPLPIAEDGRICLAISLCVIVWWGFEVMPVGLSSCALLMGYSLFLNSETVQPQLIFKFWTMPMAYMVLSGFLIAGAIKHSGIGRRLALIFISKFVKNYDQIIFACYILSYLLSLIIPQSFARAFLIMSVMSFIIEKTDMEKKYAINIGLAVFAAQNGAGLLFMTGDSSINMLLLNLIPEAMRLGWLDWLWIMLVPALLLGVLTCGMQMLLVRGPKNLCIDVQLARRELETMGPLSIKEKKTLFWLAVAVILWMTDSIHNVDVGWVSLGVAVLMAMPVIGDVIEQRDIAEINLGTLLFLNASMAIGMVGGATGMNQFLADLLCPKEISGGVMGLMLVVVLVCFGLHFLLWERHRSHHPRPSRPLHRGRADGSGHCAGGLRGLSRNDRPVVLSLSKHLAHHRNGGECGDVLGEGSGEIRFCVHHPGGCGCADFSRLVDDYRYRLTLRRRRNFGISTHY